MRSSKQSRNILGTCLATMTLCVAQLAAGAPQAAEAATGNQGYAVYRDGVAGIEWHAGIMDDPHYTTTSYPVIHHPGSGYVKLATWAQFLDKQTYKGVYRPKVAPTSAARDNFKTMARKLVGENIPYDLQFQVNYATGIGTWVDPAEVRGMRCDGVVEYVFEWYGYRVYGNDGMWDVTKADAIIKLLHSGIGVTPKIQANSYLTKITSSLP